MEPVRRRPAGVPGGATADEGGVLRGGGPHPAIRPAVGPGDRGLQRDEHPAEGAVRVLLDLEAGHAVLESGRPNGVAGDGVDPGCGAVLAASVRTGAAVRRGPGRVRHPRPTAVLDARTSGSAMPAKSLGLRYTRPSARAFSSLRCSDVSRARSTSDQSTKRVASSPRAG